MAENDNDRNTGRTGQPGQQGKTGQTGQTGNNPNNPNKGPQDANRDLLNQQGQKEARPGSRIEEEEDLGGFPSGTGRTGSGNLGDNPRTTNPDMGNRTTGTTPGTNPMNPDKGGKSDPQGRTGSQYDKEGKAERPGASNSDPNRERTDQPGSTSKEQQDRIKKDNPSGL